jgi:HPt (histidine-containing phosphotransfer) domain-containing protein
MTPLPEELQNKIAQIALRYLDRAVREVEQLRAMIDDAAGGDLDVVRNIETLAHRMHGSGAMLRFDEISAHAGELERMAVEFQHAGRADQPRMLPVLQQLQEAIERACEARRRATQT